MPNNKISGMLNAKKPMRHFSRILFLLGATFSSVALSHAQAQSPSLTVTDDLAPGNPVDHGALNHWEQFSTTLSASVSNPPQPEAETTLVGPTYQWSGGSTIVRLTSIKGQTNGLESSLGTELKPYGQNSITVNCTATYSENDSSGHFVKDLTPISGTITVKFWSTVPGFVKQVRSYGAILSDLTGNPDDTAVSPFVGAPENNPFGGGSFMPVYGQVQNFDLQLQDNQTPRLPYGWAAIREGFLDPIKGVGGGRQGLPSPYTWGVGGPPGSSNPKGNSIVGGNFTDHNGAWDNTDHRVTNGITAATVLFDFDQSWTCLEQKPPYTVNTPYDQTVNPSPPNHHLTIPYMVPTTRTGG